MKALGEPRAGEPVANLGIYMTKTMDRLFRRLEWLNVIGIGGTFGAVAILFFMLGGH